MTPTTRRYPRTLQEAFPRDYADWWEPPPRVFTSGWVRATLAIIAGWTLIYMLAAASMGAR